MKSVLLKYRQKVWVGFLSAFGCLIVTAVSFHYNVKALVWIFGGGFLFEVLSILLFIRSFHRSRPKCPTCNSPLGGFHPKDSLIIGKCGKCGTQYEVGSTA